MVVTDENGVIAESYSYDAYGTRTVYGATGQIISNQQSEVSNQYGYTGRRIDAETGLIYFRARYYSPELGRFISRDPLQFVDGMNLYAGYFAMFSGIDPYGEFFSWPMTLAGGGIGALSGFMYNLGSQIVSAAKGEGFDGGAILRGTAGGFVNGALLGAAVGAVVGDPTALLTGYTVLGTVVVTSGAGFLGGVFDGLLNDSKSTECECSKKKPKATIIITNPDTGESYIGHDYGE